MRRRFSAPALFLPELFPISKKSACSQQRCQEHPAVIQEVIQAVLHHPATGPAQHTGPVHPLHRSLRHPAAAAAVSEAAEAAPGKATKLLTYTKSFDKIYKRRQIRRFKFEYFYGEMAESG